MPIAYLIRRDAVHGGSFGGLLKSSTAYSNRSCVTPVVGVLYVLYEDKDEKNEEEKQYTCRS